MSNLLVPPDEEVEKRVLKQLAQSCGATAASIIRVDRSGRNIYESDGLLFKQLVKWRSDKANADNKNWDKCRDEFYAKNETYGVTGEALLSGRIVNVSNIKPELGTWYGNKLNSDGKWTRVQIKSSYCEPMEGLIGTSLKHMLVSPIHSNNIVVGAIKLFNHDYCETCGAQQGFEAHSEQAAEVADSIAKKWLNFYPIRCEVVVVFLDVTDSTSFLIASGYYDGARVFQVFTNKIQEEISRVAEEINNRPLSSSAASYGGVPFLDKFTGDGVLLIFPYDRVALKDEEHIESTHIWPHVKRVIEAAHKAWQSILESVECRRVLRETAMSTEPLKIAISSGPAYLGRFGGHLSAIGRPLIEASRILSDREIYETSFSAQRDSPHILASHQLVEDFKPANAQRLDKRWQLRGLPGNRFIYKVPVGWQ
jgi:class 3 adenylate cyclase